MFSIQRLREIEKMLRFRLSLEEAEARYEEFDKDSISKGFPPGMVTRFNTYLKELMKPFDELWFYSTEQRDWKELRGEQGVALVRAGKVISFLMEGMN